MPHSTFSIVNFTFLAGDAPSALADPYFIAKAGETNRVMILIGKTYNVTCQMPIICIGKSSDEIDVYQNSPTEMYICWPVTIESVAMRSGASFSMNVWPDCLGGGFTWTNVCCSISASGWTFTYSCGDTCTCSGCGAMGYYGYESYCLPACGGSCGCAAQPGVGDGGEEDDDGPYDAGASATFSKGAVIFEDRYENTPGVWVERQSTRTELHFVAHGGPNGGHVRFEIVGEDKLSRVAGISLPLERDVGPGKKVDFTIVYNGKLPSYTPNDIVATSTFTENVTNAVAQTSQATLTSLEIEIMSQIDAPENDCSYRHKFGVNEAINCNNWPGVANVSWSSTTSSNVVFQSPGAGTYRCPLYATENPLAVSYGGASYTPAISVIEPNGIQVRNPEVCTYITSQGRAGWVGLRQEFYVEPFDVSFSEISMEEVPCATGTRSGYFAGPSFGVIWCHSVANGAGEWCSIEMFTNKMGINDTARITMELLRIDGDGNFTDNPAYNWTNGEITWDIPFGWGAKPQGSMSSAVLYRQFDPGAGHRITIVPTGTVSVRKFGNEAARDIQGNTYLNGVLCQ